MASRLAGILLALTLPHLAGAFAPGAYIAPRLSQRASTVRPSLHALRCTDLQGSSSTTRRAVLQGLAVLPLAAIGTQPAEAAPSSAAGETVLVIGARGYIGEYVVAELTRQGAKVRALTRDANAPKDGTFSDVQWIAGNLNQPETITADLVKGTSRIIFCPGNPRAS